MVVTYSSINTNAFDGYGEMVMGSQRDDDRRARRRRSSSTRRRATPSPRGTTSVTVEKRAGKKPVLETSPSRPARRAATALGGLATADPSRGYREELEHFAYCVRHGDASNYHDDKDHQPRCRGEVALADAVIALTSNIAMKQNRRIEFDPEWFDYKSDETPEGTPGHRPPDLIEDNLIRIARRSGEQVDGYGQGSVCRSRTPTGPLDGR